MGKEEISADIQFTIFNYIKKHASLMSFKFKGIEKLEFHEKIDLNHCNHQFIHSVWK